MSRIKELFMEMLDAAEPCPTDFQTKKECDSFFAKYAPVRDVSVRQPVRQYQNDSVPMSVNRLFDNGDDWLDDEPWRKW